MFVAHFEGLGLRHGIQLVAAGSIYNGDERSGISDDKPGEGAALSHILHIVFVRYLGLGTSYFERTIDLTPMNDAIFVTSCMSGVSDNEKAENNMLS